MKRIFSTALLMLLTASLPAHADVAAARPVTVPFEMLKTRHMAIQIKLNGKGPYRVIFDTGSPVVLLNNKIAKESGVVPKDFKPPAFQIFGTAGEFTIDSLQLGDLKADKVPAVVMDHPTLTMASKILGPIDGIVGFPFFARYRMTLDYQAQKMTFVPNGYQPPDVMKSLMRSLMAGSDPKPKVLAPAAQWGFRVDKQAADEEAGVTINEVLPGGAAAAAGLKAGDRLLTLDDRWTDSVADCYSAASHIKPGTAAKVVVRRDGKEVEMTVTPRAGF